MSDILDCCSNSTQDDNVKSFLSYIPSIYITLGAFGIGLNAMVVFIKCKLFVKHYNNVTYIFMINLAIADVLALMVIAMGSAGMLLLPQYLFRKTLNKIMGYSLAVGWYVGSYFLCLITLSRFVAVTKSEEMHVYFSDRNKKLAMIGPWIGCLVGYCLILFYPYHVIRFFPEKATWDFDVAPSVFVLILSYENAINNNLCVVFQVYFNARTLLWLRRTQKNMAINLDQRRNRNREVKLFVQCFISSCMYAATAISFAFLNVKIPPFKEHEIIDMRSLIWYFSMAVAWIFHHSTNSMIYFILNRRLRQDVVATFCRRATQVSVVGAASGKGSGENVPTVMAKKQINLTPIAAP
uniref:G-protein coupled receptors family 1 profile domain-containing protein n=1 Tax=Romanomermis culicivorax TaxID=13658 RepID=A0A915IFZ1_ROMCU